MLVYEEIEESTMEKNALSARRVANLLAQIQRIKRWSADENMEEHAELFRIRQLDLL